MAAYPDHAPYPMDSSYPPHQSSRNDDPYNSPPAHYMDPQRAVNHTTSSSFNTKPRNSFDLESVDGTERPLTSPPPSANPSSTRGWLASFLPKSIPCRLYILIVVIETAIDLAIEGDILVRFSDIARNTDGDGGTFTRLPVYLGIFALAHVFQLALAIDAVHARNTLQFAFLAVFNALILAYAVIQIFEVDEVIAAETGITHIPIRVLTRIIPAVISLAQVAYIALGWQIWKEFGWKVYKFLGADRAVKRMYGQFQFFECLVKFDVFFWVGFSVQLIFVVLDRNDWEYYLTIAALPISILLLIEGHLAARHENKFMMVSFMAGCLAASAYFAYKLFRIWEGVNMQYYTVRKSLTIFAAVSILLLITTFVNALIVMRNFGHGLKEAMSRKKKGSPLAPRRRPSAGGDQAFSEFAMSDARKRMTID